MKKSRPKEKDRNSIPNEDIVKEEYIYMKQFHSSHARTPQEGYVGYKEEKKPIDWANIVGEPEYEMKRKKESKKK